MENKKEPLMSAEQYYHKLDAISYAPLSFAKSYAKYHTQWHLNNAKEFLADEVEINITIITGFIPTIDKQSIHTAIDNYIEINLNK